MIKKLTYFLLLTLGFTASSQSYYGFLGDNYAGVHGVLYNPATIVDSRFRADINLFSISGAVGNDFYALNPFNALKKGYDFKGEPKPYLKENNNLTFNTDIMGPSFMFNITRKHSIAVFSRARVVMSGTGINGSLIDKLKDGLDVAPGFNENAGNPNLAGHAWGELGLSYAAVLLNKKQHFLKGGLSAKYLIGGFNAYAQGQDVTARFVENPNPLLSTFTTTGTVTTGGSQDFSDSKTEGKYNSTNRGYGFDIGFIYEWRPEYAKYDVKNAKPVDNFYKDKNKYKLRFGLSVTDIGSITYKNAVQTVYNLNQTFTRQDIENNNNVKDLFDSKGLSNDYTKTTSDIKVKLPTVFHIDVDWNVYRKFYLNANGNINAINKTTLNTTSIPNNVILTPRYEIKWFSFYLPVNYMQYSGLSVGTGLRFGPLFLGSSTLINNTCSKCSKAIDVYAGLKIPVYQKHYKDTDSDGIFDQKDKCPTEAGPIENEGCPWSDSDNDGVYDKDDECPNEIGSAENKGCPWTDSDKDSVLDKDDKCPKQAGPIENNGCPWTDADKDTVLDKDDDCPTEAGPVENKGCPWSDLDKDGVLDKDDKCPEEYGLAKLAGCPEVITPKTIAKLNQYSKAIEFNLGKATLKAGTTDILDKIAETMTIYLENKFTIDGYTDNVGSEKVNLKLSKDRAETVKLYLISKGADPSRLKTFGHGTKNPIASNKTPEGRKLNRRVEINLEK